MTEKSASDVLRELLDERGVEWWDSRYGKQVVFQVGEVKWFANDGCRDGMVELSTILITPEQAITATLGEKPHDRTEEWLLKACNRATQDYVAQLEQERDELKQLVLDLTPFVCADDGIEGIEARMKALGIEVSDDER
jgi:hypothetical protein